MTDYTVHIVDDEEPVRKSLAFMLTMNGFAVKMHQSAEAFLAFAPDIRNGILVTDLRMPDMSGVELLRNLGDRKINIPSIVITGHGDVPMAVEAMKAGAVDFIEKPFEDTVIIEAIERASEHLVFPKADADEANHIRPRLQTLSERERQVLSAVSPAFPTSRSPIIWTSARALRGAPRQCNDQDEGEEPPSSRSMALAGGFGPF